MDKCIPLNTHERRRASASATVRIVRVSQALLAAGVLALLVALSGHAVHARDRLTGDVQRVKTIGFTVADADREANFFAKVLQFEKISDFRVVGSEYDKMEGVFNANMRIVHLKLGEQIVELTQYVSPPTGRPIPVPSYSNDEWFEHMAMVGTEQIPATIASGHASGSPDPAQYLYEDRDPDRRLCPSGRDVPVRQGRKDVRVGHELQDA
jgi:hypothetical protein